LRTHDSFTKIYYTMVPKDKVLAVLNAKLQGKSVTKTYKERLAEKWAAKIENEEDIETYVSDREDDILEAAADGDRRAQSATKTAKQEAADMLTGKSGDENPKEITPDPNMPEYMKAFMAKVDNLAEKVTGFEQKQSSQSLSEKFAKDERLKDVNPIFYKGRIPTSEEQFEAAVTEVATDWAAIAGTANFAQFGKDVPGSAAGAQKRPSGETKEASKEQLDAVVNNLKI